MGIIRVLLALTVLISHHVNLFGLRFTGSVIAVQCFYIISGFYMGMILEKKYSLAHYKLFITNRFLRLLPIYWTLLLLMIFSSIVWYKFSEQHSGLFFDHFFTNLKKLPLSAACLVLFSNLFIIFQDLFLFLGINAQDHYQFLVDFRNANLPLSDFLLIPQAWTVGIEILFYVLVPFLAKLKPGWLIGIIIISLSLRLAWYGMGYNFDPWTYRFFPFELMFFLLGLLAFRFYRILRSREMNHTFASVIFVGIILIIGFYQFIALNDTVKYIAFVILFTAALPVLFIRFKNNKFDRWIGEFSYPVYICHLFVIIIVNVFGSKFGVTNETCISLVILAVTFLLSYLLITFVGKPVEKYRARRLLNNE